MQWYLTDRIHPQRKPQLVYATKTAEGFFSPCLSLIEQNDENDGWDWCVITLPNESGQSRSLGEAMGECSERLQSYARQANQRFAEAIGRGE